MVNTFHEEQGSVVALVTKLCAPHIGDDIGVLKTFREKREAFINFTDVTSDQQQNEEPISTKLSLQERCRRAAMAEDLPEIKIDPERERYFFQKHGAVVSTSIEERTKIPSNAPHHFYPDGRPLSFCRISNCFNSHMGTKKQFLCARHFGMIEVTLRGESSIMHCMLKNPESKKGSASAKTNSREGRASNSDESTTRYACSYCEKEFDTYDEAAKHEKNYCGTVEEATKITRQSYIAKLCTDSID